MDFSVIKQKSYAALAPMAGVADSAFRELCAAYGSAFQVTEMISAKALTMQDKKSFQLMSIADSERPCGIQLFGSDPSVMAEGARIAEQLKPDFIDINVGCPAPKIVKNGAGSALLRDPKLTGRIMRAVRDAVTVPVSAKIRIGWDENLIIGVEIAKTLEDNGADFITVHGRTRSQMYAPPVNLKRIAEIKRAVAVPVIGNGDVTSPESAKMMYEETGCDFIMLGRGALGRPWIFSQINDTFLKGTCAPDPSKEEKMRVMLAHAARICELKGERIGINEIRKHALWYTKGLRGSAKLRNAFSTVEKIEDLQMLAEAVCNIRE